MDPGGYDPSSGNVRKKAPENRLLPGRSTESQGKRMMSQYRSHRMLFQSITSSKG
jgi:hypothetical protein